MVTEDSSAAFWIAPVEVIFFNTRFVEADRTLEAETELEDVTKRPTASLRLNRALATTLGEVVVDIGIVVVVDEDLDIHLEPFLTRYEIAVLHGP